MYTEVVTRRRSVKQTFLIIFQISKEKICFWVSFFTKLKNYRLEVRDFIERRLHVFPWIFRRLLEHLFYKTPANSFPCVWKKKQFIIVVSQTQFTDNERKLRRENLWKLLIITKAIPFSKKRSLQWKTQWKVLSKLTICV